MSKQIWICTVMVLVAATAPSVAERAAGTQLFRQEVAGMPELPAPMPPTVAVSFDTTQSADGNGSIRIDYSNPQPMSMLLYESPNPGVDNCTVWCEASLRGEGLKNIAYLEMWCDFGENGQYFSRGLDQLLQGDADWRKVRIPFFLKSGEKPARFLIGVRMEGPGTVWLDDITLSRDALPNTFAGGRSLQVAVLGTLLGLLGGLCGLWGALSGILAPRGKGRGLVIPSGWFFNAAGFAVLVAGVILTGTGSPLGWPCLLAGFIITAVLTPLNFVVRRAYQQAELRRLAAQDLQ
ncbi:MAG TPA: hypothetical protein PKY01_10240 [Candidatus Hydrogenedentes bacterium]|nr:hypothetical protein [Candidatus Hydrogenedentota bacterium]HQH52792.1 hypothetical protein [Candidatus Hydrogenedentota bacterium]HQM47786.1 hypothetical protein [Candidatus Hydrogenedentota bacterium]